MIIIIIIIIITHNDYINTSFLDVILRRLVLAICGKAEIIYVCFEHVSAILTAFSKY